MNSQHLEQLLSQLQKSLQDLYKPEEFQLILFGSQARKTAGENSDIDVAIVLKNEFDLDREIERTSHLISDLCLEYDVLINRLFMTQKYYENHSSALIRNIQSEGVLV